MDLQDVVSAHPDFTYVVKSVPRFCLNRLFMVINCLKMVKGRCYDQSRRAWC